VVNQLHESARSAFVGRLDQHRTDRIDPKCLLVASLFFYGSSEEFVGYLVHLGRASVHSNTLPDRASRRGQIGE